MIYVKFLKNYKLLWVIIIGLIIFTWGTNHQNTKTIESYREANRFKFEQLNNYYEFDSCYLQAKANYQNNWEESIKFLDECYNKNLN